MAKRNLKITKHGDTIRVQAGRYVESISTEHKTKDEIVDACRWVAITGNVSASTETISELLRENRVVA